MTVIPMIERSIGISSCCAHQSGESHERQGQRAGDEQDDCRSTRDGGNVGHLQLFANRGHEDEREREPGPGTDGKRQAFSESVAAIGLEERQRQDTSRRLVNYCSLPR